MAEEATSSQTSAPAAPVKTPEPLPEVDLDAELAKIDAFKAVFGPPESGESKSPELTESIPAAEETVTEGLDPAVPLEEEPEVVAEPEPEPEEPKPEHVDPVQRRIDKLTAQRKEAEEKAAALTAELADLKSKIQAPPPLTPTAEQPLAHLETVEQLIRQRELSRTAKQWAMQHLEGGEVDLGNGNTKFMSAEQVRNLYNNAEAMLEEHIPTQARFLAAKADYDQQAKQAFPTMFKAGHKDQIEYQALVRHPAFRRFPDVSLAAGDYIVGRNIRLAKMAAKNGKQSVNGNGQIPLAAPAPAAQPRVPKNRALSVPELRATLVNDPSGGTALDAFTYQLMDNAAQSRAQRSK